MTSLGIPQTKGETPTLSATIQAAIHSMLLQTNTAIPATVESYTPATGLINAQPSIKRKYVKDGEVVNLPIINNIPVVFPRAGQAALTFPLKKGDNVLLIFSQRSIERWKLTGGIVEAGDPRHHDLSDAFAIPGGYAQAQPLVGVDADNVVLQNSAISKITVKTDGVEIATGAGKFTVDKTGKVSLGNGAIELLDLLDKLIDALLVQTHPTGVGPSGPPINAADFAALKVQLGLIKA